MTVEELRAIKDEKGISLANLATLSGVPVGTVIKVFNGDSKNPRPSTLNALERALCDAPTKYKAIHGDTSTIDDYYRIPDGERYELIDGELIKMEAPSFIHQSIILEFCASVHNQIKALGGDCRVIMAPFDVRILKDDRNMFQPDALILCDKSKNIIKRIEGAPDMVLEVLSPSNSREYMFKKRVIYVAAGVKEYWIINPMDRTLTTFRIDDNFRRKDMPLKGVQTLAISDGLIKIDLDDIGRIIDEYEDN